MLSSLMLLGLGLAGLLIGGELTVRGATGLSRAYGVSPLFIGLTVVAFGSSAPELVVNVIGALNDQTDLAFGGVVGSNLANIGLVLGLATIVSSIHIEGQIVRREIPLLLLVTTILVVFSLDAALLGEPPELDAADGLVLLLLFVLFLYVNVGDVLAHSAADPLTTRLASVAPARPEIWPHLALTALGLAILVIGGNLTVSQASDLARLFGVTEVVIGLAVVAIGTSLPELVISLMAALRGQPDLAVGNVIGSNFFNTTFVLGISALIKPMAIPAGGVIDLLVNLLFVGLLIPFALSGPRRLVRVEGVTLLICYLAYLGYRFA